MCFAELDEYCDVFRQKIVNRVRKARKCESCRREITAGEQCLSAFYVFEGEPDKWSLCNQCAQDWVAIHRYELRQRCPDEGSWCNVSDIRSVIRHGNDDEIIYELEAFDELDDDGNGPVLFWPYDVAPACGPIDLRTLPELAPMSF